MIQNNCKLIGLTGGISTGKSTVSKILTDRGCPIIDADKIAREVVEINKPAYVKILEVFGEEILQEDKTLNRKALGKIIFNNIELREKLNQIIHPYIFQSIKANIDKLCQTKSIIILDAPLLFEQYSLWEQYNIKFDEIWLVYLDRNTQIDRLMERDNISKEEALSKIKAQINIDEKKGKSSKTIDNSGDIQCLIKQIDDLIKDLI